jgi:hypothetical protein
VLRPADLAAVLRAQDLVLVGWLVLGWPLVSRLFGGELGLSGAFEDGQPIRGLAWVLAAAGALVVAASRNSEDPPDPRPVDERLATYGPLFGGLVLVAGGGTAGLGLESGIGTGLALVALVVVMVVAGLGRVTHLPRAIRVLLVTPFILTTTGLFAGTMASIGIGPELLGDAFAATGGEPGSTTAVAGIGLSLVVFLAFTAVFYPMLVIAPRTLVDGRVQARVWLPRFAVFALGSLVGIAWLAALGG